MAEFDENLLGCLSDLPSYCLSLFPLGSCLLQAFALDKSSKTGLLKPILFSCFLCCIGGSINRGKLRAKYSIESTFIKDCLLWTCCVPCAATQEYREVNRREGKS